MSRTKAKSSAVQTKHKPKRAQNGTFLPGSSGHPGGDPGRLRRALNADTVREMHAAFRRGGRKAIDKVMKNQPAVFLKLLVLLVPRELQIEHTGGIKGMSDEQLEAAIGAIREMLEKRESGDAARVINAKAIPDMG